MEFYFAPLEGIAGYIYRNAHQEFFPHMNKYFTPFLATNQNAKLKSRDAQDILPDHNQKGTIVPQILSNNAQDFIKLANYLEEIGYNEINLNLGCPSETVVSKAKGSGFLAHKERLDTFLEEIFTYTRPKLSIKTRIGKEDPEEFYRLLDIYNKYPLEELIIHPRVQKDYYKNKPNLKIFKDAIALSKHPVCYNGDIFTCSHYRTFTEEFPRADRIMLGRGLLSNPGLVEEIANNTTLTKDTLRAFYNQIYQEYRLVLPGDTPVLYKMKELWSYMIQIWNDDGTYAKKIRKCSQLSVYNSIIESLFCELDIISIPAFCADNL